ncbi:MAG: hypothetical protein MUD11_04830, partial [Rhodobacteraceae bacterium]|nr:hypothetical protein [Paracoccaceae bacterium]
MGLTFRGALIASLRSLFAGSTSEERPEGSDERPLGRQAALMVEKIIGFVIAHQIQFGPRG